MVIYDTRECVKTKKTTNPCPRYAYAKRENKQPTLYIPIISGTNVHVPPLDFTFKLHGIVLSSGPIISTVTSFGSTSESKNDTLKLV